MDTLYTSSSRITTLREVKAFFHHAIFTYGLLEFHPDDSFASYRKFPADKVSVYDGLLDQCRAVCNAENADMYQIGLNEVRQYMIKHL